MFIADGHHRYETACNYRDELAAASGALDAEHPANFVLMQCVSMNDPGMLVLPTHRLFRGMPTMTSRNCKAKLGDCFTCSTVGKGPDKAKSSLGTTSKSPASRTPGVLHRRGRRLDARQADAMPAARRWPSSPPTTAPIGKGWASRSCTAWCWITCSA